MQEHADERIATELTEEVAANREPGHDVLPLFVNRWSARAMTGEPLEEEQYMALFEAARWAPSAFNNQHWRFVYATPDDDEWETFTDVLNDGNAWAERAGLLVAVVSKTTFDHNGEPVGSHAFDTGAAWQNLALEATRRGLAVHPMSGIDFEAAEAGLDVPERFELHAIVAVGERAAPETLPEELREREAPKGRKPLDEVVLQGGFE